jgi:multidrug efflux pump
LDHTVKSLTSLETYFRDKEHDTIQDVFSVAGVSLGGADQNVGAVSILLKDWSLRHGARASAGAIAARAQNAFSQLPDALAFAIVAPVIPELGASSGFDLELENRAGLSRADFVAARNRLIAAAAADPALIGVRVVNPDDAEELHVAIDDEKAAALGLQPLDVASTLSAAWSPTYLDDFIDHGRVKSVLMEGDAPFRSVPEDLNRWTVRGAGGEMTPFSAFARTEWRSGPSQLHGFDGYPSFEIQGAAAPGRSSGEAMAEVQKLASRLPIGVGYDWTGLSAQELQSGALAPLLYAASAVLVFVTLAAAYESWSLPLVVLGVFPLGLLGAAIAATLRGLNNDIYFQVGLLTTMGLAAKNAILMVEFALQSEARGTAALEAIIEAAMTRLRPILMTSLAFGAGVLPLMVASGAGAGSEIAIGTSVVGGMASATVLTLAFVPFLYVLVRRAFPARRPKDDPLADLIRPEAAL